MILHLKPSDTIVYVPEGKRVFLTKIQGNILDIKGAVGRPGKGPTDFAALRGKVTDKIARDNAT